MQTIPIQTQQRDYEVLLGSGLLAQCGPRIQAVSQAQRVMLVADDCVAALYGNAVQQSLQDTGFDVHRFVFPQGETSKSIATYTQLLEELAHLQFTREDLLLALGGGVCGDLAGYAAASYLRGLPFVQLPTTLLAVVDSSVGGKTAVNLSAGKNLAGAFWQPSLVLADPDTFRTLPRATFADGMAEVIKYGMIQDAALLQLLTEVPARQIPEDLLARCIRSKRDIVARDTFDHGERQLLNFGHTVGHAVECLSEYQVPHGHAVAIGMMVITRACERQGLCEPCSTVLEQLLQKWGLPTRSPYDAQALAEAAATDKKCAGGTITLVLPKRLGECVLESFARAELAAFLKPGVAE